MTRRLAFSALLAFLSIAAAPIAAEDWLQLRHDGQRSGASNDAVSLPLTDIWSIGRSPYDRQLKPFLPAEWGKEVVVWNGAVYFIIPGDRGSRLLICADGRTGAHRWHQSLAEVRPVLPSTCYGSPLTSLGITPGGILYAYENIDPRRLPAPNAALPAATFAVARLRAADGQRLEFRVPRGVYKHADVGYDPIRRVFLLHGPVDQYADIQPDIVNGLYTLGATGPRGAIGVGWDTVLVNSQYEFRFRAINTGLFGNPLGMILGAPLLAGEDLIATGNEDYVFRWRGGSSHGDLFHLRVLHPAPEHREPEMLPQARFGGFPMARCPQGFLVGNDYGNGFLAVLNLETQTGSYCVWHRDWPYALGIPSVAENTIFMNTGADPTDAIVAIDSATGNLRWTFAPQILAPAQFVGVASVEWSYAFRGTVEDREAFERRRRNNPVYVPQGRTPGQQGAGQQAPVAGQPQRPGAGQVPAPGGGPRAGSRAARDLEHTLTRSQQSVRFRRGFLGHTRNVGLVLADKKVFGVVRSSLVALEQTNGTLVWQLPIKPPAAVTSMAASRTHLFVCIRNSAQPMHGARLLALKLDSGKQEWEQAVDAAGTLAAANGLVYLANEQRVEAFGPAERTFRMAVDSASPEDYRLRAQPLPQPKKPDAPDETSGGAEAGEARAGKEEPAAPPAADPTLADATVLRLTWGQPVAEMLRKIRERRAAAPGVPMLLILDWLDPTRSRRAAGVPETWTPQETAAFASACAELAAAARPVHLDLAPEVNVYLARHPERWAEVAEFIRQVAGSFGPLSGGTRTLVSFNVEVLTGRYGKGDFVPFGSPEPLRAQDPRKLQALLESVDDVGLTSQPQVGFRRVGDIPSDYLLAARQAFGDKALVVMLSSRLNPKAAYPERDQAGYLKQVLKCCYWLDARLVAYPDFEERQTTMDGTLRTAKEPRPALKIWQETLAWKLVTQLSLLAEDKPKAEEPAGAN
jgi:outer membrane protein assembly factor BamB